MAEHYASEDEQVERLKSWWRGYGRAILAGLIIGISGLTGYRYWDGSQNVRAENASVTYEQLLQMAVEGRDEDAITAGEAIIGNYPDTAYSQLSSLILAKIAAEDGDYPKAKKYLKTLIDRLENEDLTYLARARLARIVLAEGAIAEANSLMSAIPSLEGRERFAELRADIAAADGDHRTAKTMYLQAIEKANARGIERGELRLKLDNLGLGEK